MDNNERVIGKWISMIYRYSQIYIGRKLKDYNIGSGHYPFLMELYKNDGISQEELSGRIKIDKATTAKAIKKLEEEGYILRRTDDRDKRAYRVFLTYKALELKPVLYDMGSDWVGVLYSNMSENEKELALKLVEIMAENASSILEKEDANGEESQIGGISIG